MARQGDTQERGFPDVLSPSATLKRGPSCYPNSPASAKKRSRKSARKVLEDTQFEGYAVARSQGMLRL
jgi:hypothetical protein